MPVLSLNLVRRMFLENLIQVLASQVFILQHMKLDTSKLILSKWNVYQQGNFILYNYAFILFVSLGMHHDSSGNSCSKEGYVMSPSRGTNGETQWSSCSAEVMAKLG